MRGDDLTVTANPIVLRVGSNVSELNLDTVGPVKNAILIGSGEQGTDYTTKTNGSSISSYGRKETFLSLQDVSSEYDYIANIAIDLFWQISGPLNDYIQTNGVRVAGIEDTNKRLVASKSIKFRGLEEFIGGNYTKFAKPS